jgi:hypothetical protein
MNKDWLLISGLGNRKMFGITMNSINYYYSTSLVYGACLNGNLVIKQS